MKKVLSVLAVSALVFGFSSCKKSGECTCEFAGTSVVSHSVTDADKDQYEAAETLCETSNTNAQAAGGSCTWAEK